MIRLSTIAIGLTLGLNLLAPNATAQWGYPGGYGGYGMSQMGSRSRRWLHGRPGVVCSRPGGL